MMASLALLLLGLTAAQPAPPAETDTIVVTGVRSQDYRDRLAACLARTCPPDEDIAATLMLAEALFLDGDYREARAVIRASLSRNRDEARDYPEPVAGLYRANTRVARNLGFDRDAALSTRATLRALQTGLPIEDHRHFTARLEIVEQLVAFGQYDQARRDLAELAERAAAAGREDVAIMAELRSLWIAHLQAPGGSQVERSLIGLSRSSDLRRSIGAKMLLVRIYGERGQTERADALIAELGRGNVQRQLLYAPPYDMRARDQGGAQQYSDGTYTSTDTTLARRVGNMEDQWIDVGFWIQPDGQVGNLEIVRSDGARDWASPVLESIRGRRYSRLDGTQATYRLERYTYTSGYEARTGSRIQQRSPRARVEYFDLSTGTPTAAPPPGSTGGNAR